MKYRRCALYSTQRVDTMYLSILRLYEKSYMHLSVFACMKHRRLALYSTQCVHTMYLSAFAGEVVYCGAAADKVYVGSTAYARLLVNAVVCCRVCRPERQVSVVANSSSPER